MAFFFRGWWTRRQCHGVARLGTTQLTSALLFYPAEVRRVLTTLADVGVDLDDLGLPTTFHRGPDGMLHATASATTTPTTYTAVGADERICRCVVADWCTRDDDLLMVAASLASLLTSQDDVPADPAEAIQWVAQRRSELDDLRQCLADHGLADHGLVDHGSVGTETTGRSVIGGLLDLLSAPLAAVESDARAHLKVTAADAVLRALVAAATYGDRSEADCAVTTADEVAGEWLMVAADRWEEVRGAGGSAAKARQAALDTVTEEDTVPGLDNGRLSQLAFRDARTNLVNSVVNDWERTVNDGLHGRGDRVLQPAGWDPDLVTAAELEVIEWFHTGYGSYRMPAALVQWFSEDQGVDLDEYFTVDVASADDPT
jgi:hypothetical protein